MSRGAGRVLTGVGLVLAVAGIASATSNILSLLWLRSEDATSSYPASASLRVDSNCGDVDVRGCGRVRRSQLSTHVWWSFGKPSVTVDPGRHDPRRDRAVRLGVVRHREQCQRLAGRPAATRR